MQPEPLTAKLRAKAQALGFGLVGVAPAVTPEGVMRLDEWLSRGYAGEMGYLAGRRDAYQHPDRLLDGARSVVMLGLDYRTAEPETPQPGQGRVSRYAWGDRDYHDVIRPKLHALADSLREWAPGADARGVVDTAPLMERDFARLAGLGWIGKNTLLLNRERGSWLFLAALVTDTLLEYDAPSTTDHCGTCTACLDACPTNAFPSPRVLDASRCISYLTIEAPGLPSEDLRDGVGDWLFGCDVCQEVCPWNRFAPRASEEAFEPLATTNPCDLFELFDLSDDAFRQRFKQTPLWRPKRRGLLRNAAIVLGNTKPDGGEAPLAKGLRDPEPLVRSAAAWALGVYSTNRSLVVLQNHLEIEEDQSVLIEIRATLANGLLGEKGNSEDVGDGGDEKVD